MKKIILTLTIFASSFLVANAQSTYTYISNDNIKAQVNNNGMLFNDMDQDLIGFEAPKGSKLTTLYTSSLWIGGLDKDDKLHMAAQTYGQKGSDYWSGPIDKNGSASVPENWDKLYHVSATDIELHKLSYKNAGYQVPDNIANWPVDFGSNYWGPYRNYADMNTNGVYDPENGDYPYIMGNEEAYFILNDLYSVHSETTAAPLGIELRVHVYLFNDAEVGNTVFARYEVINRSANDYHDVHAGIYSDFDIGTYNDDFIGTYSPSNMYFGYNGEPTDDSYGANPPAQGVVFLNQTLDYTMTYNNDFSPTGNPQTAAEYYNYLTNKDKAGTPFANEYVFDGNPCIDTGDNETGFPADRRMLGTTIIGNLDAGASYTLDVAYVFALGTSNTNSVCELINRVKKVRQLYNNGAITDIEDIDTDKKPILIYPNPTSGSTTIKFHNPNKQEHELYIYSSTGKLVLKVGEIYENEYLIGADVLPQGIYYVRVRKKTDNTSNSEQTVKLVVK